MGRKTTYKQYKMSDVVSVKKKKKQSKGIKINSRKDLLILDGKASPLRNMKQVKRQTLSISEGTAKALRLKHTWHIQGIAKTKVCLKKSEGEWKMRSERQEKRSEAGMKGKSYDLQIMHQWRKQDSGYYYK